MGLANRGSLDNPLQRARAIHGLVVKARNHIEFLDASF